MKLSIKERIKVSELLADQVGSATTMKLIREARENLSLSEEEIKIVGYIEVPNPNGGTSMGWDSQKDPIKDIQFGDTVLNKLKSKLKRLDESEQLTDDQALLYEKFFDVSV